jgi:hypothetical protein
VTEVVGVLATHNLLLPPLRPALALIATNVAWIPSALRGNMSRVVRVTITANLPARE